MDLRTHIHSCFIWFGCPSSFIVLITFVSKKNHSIERTIVDVQSLN